MMPPPGALPPLPSQYGAGDMPLMPPGVNVPPPPMDGGTGPMGMPPATPQPDPTMVQPPGAPPMPPQAPQMPGMMPQGGMDAMAQGGGAPPSPSGGEQHPQYSVEPQADGSLVLMVHGGPGSKPIVAKVLTAPKRTLNHMQKANVT